MVTRSSIVTRNPIAPESILCTAGSPFQGELPREVVRSQRRKRLSVAAIVGLPDRGRSLRGIEREQVRANLPVPSIDRRLLGGVPAGKVHLEPSVFYDLTEEGGTWVLGLTIGHEW